MSSKVFSAVNIGLESRLIEVEVDTLTAGLHQFNVVGLPDATIKESRDRVSSALRNCQFRPPHQCGRVTVNLAPADIKKEGPLYDLPIAIAFLLATGQLSFDQSKKLFIGELSLDGRIKPVKGVLPIILMAKEKGYDEVYLPLENAREASVVKEVKILPATHLLELISHLRGDKLLYPYEGEPLEKLFEENDCLLDMSSIHGQEHAKRALEIAAAGAHNVLLNGPPGSGKTLLAKTMVSILPQLNLEESLEITKIFSVAGCLLRGTALITQRPFRSPHHSASAVSLVGGGAYPRPGEISLAHRGVLFLDEFPEFSRNVLENMRQPLEDGMISVSRAQGTLQFPARFTLIAAMNPCPCGFSTDPEKSCTCPPASIIKYQRKISGPILDRIDIQIEVPRLKFEKLSSEQKSESSLDIRRRVNEARRIQKRRFGDLNIITNSEMNSPEIKKFCQLDQTSLEIMRGAVTRFHLSARSYFRIIKVARTIADLESSENIGVNHLAEALQYRFKTE